MNKLQEKALSTVKDFVKDDVEVKLMIDILGLDQEPLETQGELARAFSGNRPTNKSHSLHPKIQIRF